MHVGASSLFEVYPRACGGTPVPVVLADPQQGLSPRLRGNRGAGKQRVLRLGSIPAPAGEPTLESTTMPIDMVYPRACGGTSASGPRLRTHIGLSPRLRGNRGYAAVESPYAGSIPAPAGEPGAVMGPHTKPAVYPRACGGTYVLSFDTPNLNGLSPRLRGNPLNLAVQPFALRSIPAPAGEPYLHLSSSLLRPVYPRACGGTSPCSASCRRSAGLSPRLRGNLQGSRQETEANRSIPAPAGEPH